MTNIPVGIGELIRSFLRSFVPSVRWSLYGRRRHERELLKLAERQRVLALTPYVENSHIRHLNVFKETQESLSKILSEDDIKV